MPNGRLWRREYSLWFKFSKQFFSYQVLTEDFLYCNMCINPAAHWPMFFNPGLILVHFHHLSSPVGPCSESQASYWFIFNQVPAVRPALHDPGHWDQHSKILRSGSHLQVNILSTQRHQTFPPPLHSVICVETAFYMYLNTCLIED